MCACKFFTCRCNNDKDSEAPKNNNATPINISISPKQYNNIEKLAKELYDMKANNAVKYLAIMIESMKKDDTKLFNQSRDNFFTEIDRLDEFSKNRLDNFIANLEA